MDTGVIFMQFEFIYVWEHVWSFFCPLFEDDEQHCYINPEQCLPENPDFFSTELF